MTERPVSRALFAARREEIDGAAADCGRIYFGQEFCASLLPSPKALSDVRRKVRGRGLLFTLVTPRLDEGDLERLRRLLEAFDPGEGDEVVANDVGLLEMAREISWPGPLSAGRLLTKQRRGAAWKGLLPGSEGAARWLRGSSLDSPGWVEWLGSTYGVKRFEIDNLIQGVEVRDLPGDVTLSVHHPFLVLTVTRHCPWSFDGRLWRTGGECRSPCRTERLRLRHAGEGRGILMGGMAQFLRNDSDEIYSGPAVDRHVLQGPITVERTA